MKCARVARVLRARVYEELMGLDVSIYAKKTIATFATFATLAGL